MATAHQYHIAAKDVGAHLFEVRVTVARPDPAGQSFSIPAWIPGSYMIRDFAKNIISFKTVDGTGHKLEHKKLNKSCWQIPAIWIPHMVFLMAPVSFLQLMASKMRLAVSIFNNQTVNNIQTGKWPLVLNRWNPRHIHLASIKLKIMMT